MLFLSPQSYALDSVETIDVAWEPTNAVTVYNKLFVTNPKNNTVDVIDANKNTLIKSIPVGKIPMSAVVSGNKIYVNNFWDNTVTVIDAVNNQVLKSVLADLYPASVVLQSGKIYAPNSWSDTVSIIDTATNNSLGNVKLGANVSQPGFVFIVSYRVIVLNQGTSNISIIDEKYKSFKKIVWISGRPSGWTLVWKYVYIYHDDTNIISVFSAEKEALTSIIKTEAWALSGTLVWTKLYVNHPTGNYVSIIDTTNNTIRKVISVGKYPISSTLIGTKLYVNNRDDNSISVIDTLTDQVVQTVSVEKWPISSTKVGNKLYINSPESGKISVFYTEPPILSGIASITTNGKYGVGAKIDISMVFDQPLAPGSSANVTLNNGVKVNLSTINKVSLIGEYTVTKEDTNIADLSVVSLSDIRVKGISGAESTTYSIPKGKNLGDYKNISIDTSIVTASTPSTLTPEDVCKLPSIYRTCPLSKAPENSTQYRENMICEGFISEKQPPGKRISRIEVLNIAVNMLRGLKSSASEYNDTYSDITREGNSQETVSVIQTGLDNGLIFPNNGAFEPTKQISRIEAYALLMRGVCMQPEESSDMARAIHQKALQNNITTKQWARFRPYSSITRNEVYIVASQLANWADKNGGCDALQCRK